MMPVTTPVTETVATLVLLLLHVPLLASAKVIVLPTHTLEGPVIAAGSGLTVTLYTSCLLPQEEYPVTV